MVPSFALSTAKMPGGFVLDTRRDPFHLQVIASHFTYAEVNAHFDEVEACYEKYFASRSRAHVALLADARRVPYADPRSRQRVAQAFARVSSFLGANHSVAHAVVTNNAVTRGALTAILWLFSPPWQIRVFTSMSEADAWLRGSFTVRGASGPLPPTGWWREAGAPA